MSLIIKNKDGLIERIANCKKIKYVDHNKSVLYIQITNGRSRDDGTLSVGNNTQQNYMTILKCMQDTKNGVYELIQE